MSTSIPFHTLIPLIVAFGLSHLFLPKVIRFSMEKGWVDVPDQRKVHLNAIPRTGGLVLVPAIGAAILLALLPQEMAQSLGLLGGLLVLYGTGLYDDLYGLPAIKKLFLQILAATFLVLSGWKVTELGGYELPMVMQYLLTVIGITAVVNAYNLIDGIDGLAGSLAVMAGMAFMWMFYQAQDSEGVVIAAAMTGAFGAFLIFNFAPARIFMGDAGSMSLGFLLAALSIRLLHNTSGDVATFQLWQPIAVLSIPLYDVIRVIVDRARRHGKLFRAEKNHIHHLLLENGLSHRASVTLILVGNGSMIFLSLLRPNIPTYVALPILTLVFLLGVALIRSLTWYKMKREQAQLDREQIRLGSDNPFFEHRIKTR